MGEFFGNILNRLEELWPFRIVRQWERAGYYVVGKFWRVVGPGVYPIIPWFTAVHEVTVVPAIVQTPRTDITLADGTPVSFSASAWVQVTDVNLAVNTVDNFHQTTVELITAVCAERLAGVDADRLSPERRGRFLTDLRRWCNEESNTFGVEVQKLRFASFTMKVKTIRLLGGGEMIHSDW
jgi:regulator of protease activity HflC (stomatin/prohibitin superfamily)